MNCFYCGKRVSLVRKRIDPDFCSEEHRRHYHARTRRSMEVLAEAGEGMAVTRRLHEGFALATHPLRGAHLEDLLQRDLGQVSPFAAQRADRPRSRARVETNMPRPALFPLPGSGASGRRATPAGAGIPGTFGRVQPAPRPPRSYVIGPLLPAAGLSGLRPTASGCDRPAAARPPARVESQPRAQIVSVPRLARPLPAGSMRPLRQLPPRRHPGPATSSAPPRPLQATVRQAAAAVLPPRRQVVACSARLPQPGALAVHDRPAAIAARGPASASARFGSPPPVLPSFPIPAAAVPQARAPHGTRRLVPSPHGIRRKHYYSWEAPAVPRPTGLEAIRGSRPCVRPASAPPPLPPLRVPALQPKANIAPAHPGPVPSMLPFPGTAVRPRGTHLPAAGNLPQASPSVPLRPSIDSAHVFAAGETWQKFAILALVPLRRRLDTLPPSAWVSAAGACMPMRAWVRPQPRAAARIPGDCGITARKPVFLRPLFVSGRRQAGPAPQRRLPPPSFGLPPAPPRAERIAAQRAARLPLLAAFSPALRQRGLQPGRLRFPICGNGAVAAILPAYPIPAAPSLPLGSPPRTATSGSLQLYSALRPPDAASQARPAAPQRFDREPLSRLCRRGAAAPHIRCILPRGTAWPLPGLLPAALPSARPHPRRDPRGENPPPLSAACTRPGAAAFLRARAIRNAGALVIASPALDGGDRQLRPLTLPLPTLIVLPIDPHGPIRDWGLAPPPEPEKPPEPIHEDFSSGLGNWLGSTADWRQDIAGVRTGSLALLRPTLPLRDYEFEFLGKIENRSLGWVFRAADAETYHAVQIVADASGGAARLLRFAVLAGRREPSSDAVLPLTVASKATCRVRMAVEGHRFKVFLNDQPAAEWSDHRLAAGGIGFFSEAHDRARLYWVKVTPRGAPPAEEPYAAMAHAPSAVHHEIRMGV